MSRERARWEFSLLIDRCGCSRAGVYLTEEEIKEAGFSLEYMQPTIPSCTPHRCFPELMKMLYPNGGFNKKSDTYRQTMQKFRLVTKPRGEEE